MIVNFRVVAQWWDSGSVRVGVAQIRASRELQETLLLIEEAVSAASAAGADLVVFPEAAMCSFLRDPQEVAEPLDGPWATRVSQLARGAGVIVVAGMFTVADDGRVHNTLLVAGEEAMRYDKIHLFDALGQRESDRIAPGKRLVTVDIAGQRIGLATCYDVRFPNQFLDLAGLGAKIMIVCASWAPGTEKLHQWRTLVAARAMDSTSFVIAVDQAGSDDDVAGVPVGIGHSMVVGPTGQVLLELGSEPDLAFVDLDIAHVDAARAALPVLESR